MDYHRIEKGMALPKPRVGFGTEVIERLMDNADRYVKHFGDDALIHTVRGVLSVYQGRQAGLGYHNEALDAFLESSKDTDRQAENECGVIPVNHAALFPFTVSGAEQMILSRRSVRQYTGELVEEATLRRITELAQRAPSVCNRQAGRLYAANTRKRIDEVLRFQNGNTGFGHTLGAVFIVTADLQAFTSLGERNQGYVDGGIFAMQTLAAIHAQKLGGCMLNWSAPSKRDKRLRKSFGIPDSEVVITMIGCGYPIDEPEVACSPRVTIDQVLRMV
jgi:nitroreductase